MKKIISIVLALTMVFSMLATASALTISDYITSTDEYFLSYTLPINIEARRTGATGYNGSSLVISDSNLFSGIGVDFKATLDMSQINTLFSSTLMSGFLAEIAGDTAAKTEFETAPVTTTVTVSVEYPGATIANAETAGSLTSGNTIFEQNGDRVINGNTATITYKNSALTVAQLMANNATYLQNVVFELNDAATYNTEGNHEVKVTFSGETTLGFSSKPIKIKYEETSKTYTVSTSVPSTGGGGGSSLYTVKLNANGGTGVGNIRVKRGGKVSELPIPTRDGYVFEGWYVDSAFKTEFDLNTVINKGITLYAKWTEIAGGEDEENADCSCHKFTDLDKTMWYHSGVDYVIDKGMMNGVSDTEFAPDKEVTRAMLVTVLWRAEGMPAAENTTFTDLEDGLYYVDAVKWAVANGIVNGYSDTEFAPNAAITREQFVAIMYRYATNKGYDVTAAENTNILSYSDNDAVSEYAIEAMQYALGSGLINGRTESTLNPTDNTTRAEMATILYRFFAEK